MEPNAPPLSDEIISEKDRYSVPWDGFDVVVLFILWISLTIACLHGVLLLSGSGNVEAPSPRTVTDKHPLTQLLEQGRKQPVILLVAFLCAVILTPMTEEFLFRLVFQGWLQKKTASLWNVPSEKNAKYLPGGLSVFGVSLVFAAMHGGQRSEHSVEVLFYGISGLAIANLLTLCIGVSYLAITRRASRRELGFSSNHLTFDLLLGCGTFILCGPAILFLNMLLRSAFPENATDPIPLFLFSIALGCLYFKTRRLLPSIVMHACLNGFSFFALIWGTAS